MDLYYIYKMLIDQNYNLDNICKIMGQKQIMQIIKFKENELEVSTPCTGTPVLLKK